MPIDIRRNDDGSLDEIAAPSATIHLERLDDNHWWLRIEQDGRLYHVNFTARRAKIAATVMCAA